MRNARLMKLAMTTDFSASRRSSVRVLLADDSREILDHVSNLLQPRYTVIGKVADGKIVCSEALSLVPDIIILDISMGDCSGIEIARLLREQGYAKEIVFLSVHEDPDFVTAAIGAGGRAYVTKARVTEDLGLALDAVLTHRIFISAPLEHS